MRKRARRGRRGRRSDLRIFAGGIWRLELRSIEIRSFRIDLEFGVVGNVDR